MNESCPIVLREEVERFSFSDVGEGGGERVDLCAWIGVCFGWMKADRRMAGSDGGYLMTETGGNFEDVRFAGRGVWDGGEERGKSFSDRKGVSFC